MKILYFYVWNKKTFSSYFRKLTMGSCERNVTKIKTFSSTNTVMGQRYFKKLNEWYPLIYRQ